MMKSCTGHAVNRLTAICVETKLDLNTTQIPGQARQSCCVPLVSSVKMQDTPETDTANEPQTSIHNDLPPASAVHVSLYRGVYDPEDAAEAARKAIKTAQRRSRRAANTGGSGTKGRELVVTLYIKFSL